MTDDTVKASRKVHVLEDNEYPEGPMICGKTSVQVLGSELAKGDVLCRKCAAGILARSNEYADEIDILREELIREQGLRREQRLLAARSRRMLDQLLERFLDVPPID